MLRPFIANEGRLGVEAFLSIESGISDLVEFSYKISNPEQEQLKTIKGTSS